MQLLTGLPVCEALDERHWDDDGELSPVLDPRAGWSSTVQALLIKLASECMETLPKRRPKAKAALELLEGTKLQQALARGQQSGPPDSHLCPISGEVMEDPVITAAGHSYEREQIEMWLASNDTDPLTNKKLQHKSLVPNHALRKAIQEACPLEA